MFSSKEHRRERKRKNHRAGEGKGSGLRAGEVRPYNHGRAGEVRPYNHVRAEKSSPKPPPHPVFGSRIANCNIDFNK